MTFGFDFFCSSIDEILLLTVVTTAILVVIIGMAVRVLVVTESAEVQKKLTPQSKHQKKTSLDNTPAGSTNNKLVTAFINLRLVHTAGLAMVISYDVVC